MSDEYWSFYGERTTKTYGQDRSRARPEDHDHYELLRRLIREHDLAQRQCLEIGSSVGLFQDMVEHYHGTDISPDLARHYHKPYRVAEGERYPFDDGMFDAIWSFHVFEHIPHLQQALLEIERLLKPGGVLFFFPAWQCRPWAAQGYAVRPWSDFGLRGKLIKASVPLRESVLWRSLFVFPKRLWRHALFLAGKRYQRIRYRKLRPNYEEFYTTDADACNHIDPHDAILWFASHGFECLSHPLHAPAFMVRSGCLVFRKRATAAS